MRISVILVIFLILFNAWGGLLIKYDVDDHLGINAETGNAEELEKAQNIDEDNIRTGEAIGGTLLGFYNRLLTSVSTIVKGLQPGVQLLTNITPPGIAEDLIIWGFSALPVIIAADMLAYARGVDL